MGAEKIDRYESKPLLKVTGRPIQLLLEVGTVATVREKLRKMGFNPFQEYVKEEDILNSWPKQTKDEGEDLSISYNAKSEESDIL